MRIFWLNHGLHAEPESQEEANILVTLVESVHFTDKYGEPRELRRKPLLEGRVIHPQVVPNVPSLLNGHNEESISGGIDVLHEITLNVENAAMELQNPLGVENPHGL